MKKMMSQKAESKPGKAANPEGKKTVRDPKPGFSKTKVYKNEPDVVATNKRPKGARERLVDKRI